MALRQMEPTMVQVGGMDFYITPFAAFKAANLTGELASVLTPLLGALAPLAKENDLMDVDAGKAASAMASCTAISGDKLEKLTRKLLLGGHVVAEVLNQNGEKETVRLDSDLADELFCGDVQDLFVLCFHVIRLNFNGFFKKLSTLSGKGKEKGGEAGEEPAEPTETEKAGEDPVETEPEGLKEMAMKTLRRIL